MWTYSALRKIFEVSPTYTILVALSMVAWVVGSSLIIGEEMA